MQSGTQDALTVYLKLTKSLKANQVKERRACRSTVTFRKSPCGLYSDLSLSFSPFLVSLVAFVTRLDFLSALSHR